MLLELSTVIVTGPDIVGGVFSGSSHPPAWFQQKLSQHGFAVPLNGELDKRTQETLSAFQMKYRQSRFDGVPDAETAALLDVITTPPAPTQPKS